MINILLRTVILYLVVLFIIRVMGKGELSKLDPFQVVILFMIAELAALPIETPEISLVSGLTSLLTLLFLQVVFSFFSIKSRRFKDIVSGKATILIANGAFNEAEMNRLRITVDDLMEQLRLKNYASVADVEYAILEANGDLSVVPMPEKSPLKRSDMGLSPNPEQLPLLLIADGTLYPGNLALLGRTEADLCRELSEKGHPDPKEIFLCYSDEAGVMHIYPKTPKTIAGESGISSQQRWDIE